MKSIIKLFFISVTLILGACISIDKTSVQARSGAPESARVARLEIPYDSSLPRYSLVVHTFVKEGPVSEYESHSTNTSTNSGNNSYRTDSNTNKVTRSVDQELLDTKISDKNKTKELSLYGMGNQGESENPQEIDSAQAHRKAAKLQKGESERDLDITAELRRKGQVSEEVKGSTRSGGKYANRSTSDSDFRSKNRSWEVNRSDVNIAAQFTSSLAGIQNFVVLDPSAVISISGGRYKAITHSDKIGPFIVKAIVTEHVDEVEADSSKFNLPLFIHNGDSVVKGVVVLDITVLDGRSAEIVASFPSEGTYISQNKKSTAGIVLPISEQRVFARSVVEQAQRVALNEAARKIFEVLSPRYSK